MDEERLSNDEYEEQYYGFSSTSLYEDFKEQVRKSIKMALKEMEVALKEQQYDEVLKDQKIVDMYTVFMERAKIPLEKFKDEARKIFSIPKNVILDEDEYNTDSYSDKDIINLRKEVAELEKVLLREQVFLAKCKQQREMVDTVIKPLYEKVNSMIAFSNNSPQSVEDDKNYKKTIDLCEKYNQYYLRNEDTEREQSDILNIEQNFIKPSDFFK